MSENSNSEKRREYGNNPIAPATKVVVVQPDETRGNNPIPPAPKPQPGKK